MVKMHKSPTRRRFPCAGDVPRFHHLRVRQRRVFRRTAGSQSRSFCSFPRFRRWWRGHALCVTSRVFLHAKSPARRNSMNSFSLVMVCAYMYLAFYSATLFTERKKERLSFPSTDANTFFALRERERERKRLRFLRVKNGANRTIPPKRKSALEVREMIQRDGNDGETRVNATQMNNLHDALRARETYGSTKRTVVSKKRRNALTRQEGNAGELDDDGDDSSPTTDEEEDDDEMSTTTTRRRKTTEGKRGKGNQ